MQEKEEKLKEQDEELKEGEEIKRKEELKESEDSQLSVFKKFLVAPIEDDANKLSRSANMIVILVFNGCREILREDLESYMGGSVDKIPGTIAYCFACGLGGRTK